MSVAHTCFKDERDPHPSTTNTIESTSRVSFAPKPLCPIYNTAISFPSISHPPETHCHAQMASLTTMSP